MLLVCGCRWSFGEYIGRVFGGLRVGEIQYSLMLEVLGVLEAYAKVLCPGSHAFRFSVFDSSLVVGIYGGIT